MFIMPFGMSPQQSSTSAIDELDKTIKFYEAMKKSFNEDKDKKKDFPPRKSNGDILTTAIFLTLATPFIMLVYSYFMTQMLLGVLEALAKIKGL